MLSPLQEQVAEIVAGLEEAEYEQLAREIVGWREQALALSQRREPGQEHERDFGREL